MPLGMLLLLFRQRQRKDKLRTNAFRADTVDIFSMCLDDFGVFDGNKDFLIFFGRLDRDCGVCVAEFERIVDQVIKYLLDLAEISGDKQGFAA